MKNIFDCNCDVHDKEIVGLYLPKSNRFVKVNVCANDLRSIISEPCIFVKEELEYVAEKWTTSIQVIIFFKNIFQNSSNKFIDI